MVFTNRVSYGSRNSQRWHCSKKHCLLRLLDNSEKKNIAAALAARDKRISAVGLAMLRCRLARTERSASRADAWLRAPRFMSPLLLPRVITSCSGRTALLTTHVLLSSARRRLRFLPSSHSRPIFSPTLLTASATRSRTCSTALLLLSNLIPRRRAIRSQVGRVCPRQCRLTMLRFTARRR